MKKVLFLAFISMLVSSSVHAAGVGVGWSNGLSVCIPAGSVDLQGILGFNKKTPGDDTKNDITTVNLTGYIMFPFTKVDKAKLSFFTGMTLRSVSDMDNGLGFMAGLAPAVKVTKHLALSAKVGLKYMKNPVIKGGDADKDFGLCGGVAVHWFFY